MMKATPTKEMKMTGMKVKRFNQVYMMVKIEKHEQCLENGLG